MPNENNVNFEEKFDDDFDQNVNAEKLSKILDKTEVKHENYFSYHQFKKRQNIAIVTVGLVTLLVVVLGAVQISSMFRIPFPDEDKYTGDTSAYDAILAEQKRLLEQDPEILKTKDTDGDGVNDFDELYVYDTSVYLADSDSDGIDDGVEIKNYTDPLCPEGYDCYTTYDDAGEEVAVSSNGTVNATVTEVSASDLRKMIVASGQATEAQVQGISDASLMQMYETMLEENPDIKEQMLNYISGSTAGSTEPVSITDLESSNVGQTLNTLTTLTPSQVRAIMIEQGFSGTELNALDDQTLMEIYYEAVDEASQTTLNN